MKTIIKKSLCFLIGLFILFSFNCYAGETLTAQQKEAEVWYEKANSVDTLALKIEYYSKAIELDPKLAAAYNNRGHAYALQKSSTAACGDFYQAGILFLKQNNTTQALICVDWMKKINPSSPLINKLMDQINK